MGVQYRTHRIRRVAPQPEVHRARGRDSVKMMRDPHSPTEPANAPELAASALTRGDEHIATVSACLLGAACRYDGQSKATEAALRWQREMEAAGMRVVAVCPEELGGLGTPRPAAELRGGDGADVWRGRATVRRVADGADVTAAFRAGAERAWALAAGAETALLKARSPSCGVGRTHIDGQVALGDGVFAALLRERGVAVQTEDDIAAAGGAGGGIAAQKVANKP